MNTSGGAERSTLKNEVTKEDERQRRWGKYKPALRTMLPYRFSKSSSGVLPSSTSGLLSFATVSWLTTLMWKAFKEGLTPEDLWELNEADKAERNARRMQKLWEEEKFMNPETPSFFKTVWRFGKTRFYLAIFVMIMTALVQFMVPAWILKWLLSFNEDLSQPIEIGIGLAILIVVTQLVRNVSFCLMWMIGIHTGVRVQGAMQFMTYEKLLRLRSSGENVLAKAVTFCTNDQERIFECVGGGVMALGAPIMFIMSIIYTAIVIGPWSILGNVVIFIFYPIMGLVAATVARIRRKTVKRTNERVGMMAEILNSIRLIKMYGWEDSFAKKLEDCRAQEEQELRKAAFLQSMTVTMTPMVNIVASVSVFLGYSLSGNDLTSSTAWSIYSVFAAMQFTLGTLPFAVRSIGEATVCFKNFQAYLDLPEYENITTENLPCDHDSVVVIRDGEFTWDSNTLDPAAAAKPRHKKIPAETGEKSEATEKETEVLTQEVEETPCLANVNLDVKRGKLVGISGLTGSGKSSLISAVLGDMRKTKGDVLIRGSLAIVSQQAWIYSDTFQDNILFGSPLNKEKYEKVLEVCSLKPDLRLLPQGDQTIIGDRGVNLSGGQKQRLNLARALYADRSIYLLDDPLSAVDAIVGKQIFQQCIKEYLKDKTILLVTHNLEFLEKCDDIIFVKSGAITERGTHVELMEMQEDYYYLCQFSQTKDKSEHEEAESPVKAKSIEHENSNGKSGGLTDASKPDELKINNMGFNPHVMAIKAGGGFFLFICVLILVLLFALVRLFTIGWVRVWIDAGDGSQQNQTSSNITDSLVLETNGTRPDSNAKGSITENPDLGWYQLVLFLSVLAAYGVGTLKGLAATRFVLRGASRLHNQMFCRVMDCPLSFFDRSPVGRIVNRFSKDMDELDSRMPFFFEFVCQAIVEIISGILVVSLILPWLSFVMIILLGCMFFIAIWLTKGVRQTKQLDNILKSPVVGHIQSSMGGLSIIRTYNRQNIFQKRFCEYVNRHLAAEMVSRVAPRWFTVRLDCIGLLAIFSTVLFGVLNRDAISSATVGLTFTIIYSVCTFMPFAMRMLSELNARFTSVERILEYGMTLETESQPENPMEVNDAWPSTGSISVNSLSLRYAPESSLALDDVSFSVVGGEKVGIVGRTGAGKTTILSAVLRLVDYENGTIFIDGVDSSRIPRKFLRQKIAVIPQDPVLFQGSVRYNIDPFGVHSDEELFEALEQANLKSKISKLKNGLESKVETEGENFSVGEKQLICLARALLRRSKILFLDEATASVDVETDAFIQSTIRTVFSSCTVLTIAHRLNTIASYDKILVLDGGKVSEFDTPANLMTNQDSLFFKMMKAAGISTLEHLPHPAETGSD